MTDFEGLVERLNPHEEIRHKIKAIDNNFVETSNNKVLGISKDFFIGEKKPKKEITKKELANRHTWILTIVGSLLILIVPQALIFLTTRIMMATVFISIARAIYHLRYS